MLAGDVAFDEALARGEELVSEHSNLVIDGTEGSK